MNKLYSFFFNRKLLLLITLFVFVLFPKFTFATIQIDSIKSTISTCPNNATITVYAVTTAPPVLYSIIAGPVTQAWQTSNQFNSLPAGNYTIKITNAASETATQNITVTGNYTQLDFAPLTTSPYCNGGSDGKIVGNLIPNTGNAPYTWQLVAPSPVVRPPQANDTFYNLVAGNYSVRVTDGCGSFRTIVATVTDIPVTNLIIVEPLSRINMIGCDSAMFTLYMYCSAYRPPFTCSFQTSAGTFTTTTPTRLDTSPGNGAFIIEQLFPGFTYGDFISATITDDCGSTVSTPFWFSQPFNFCTVTTSDFTGCDYSTQLNFDLNNATCYNINEISTYAKAPLSYVVTDLTTNLVALTDTLPGYELTPGYNTVSGFQLSPLPGNVNYSIKITDSCGRVFTSTFFIPDVPPPAPTVAGMQITPDACVDSASFAGIILNNFRANPEIIFLSGPALMGSTKPEYEYSNMHVYPDTVRDHGHFFGGSSDIFFISGLSVGTYQFKVIDSCGSEVFDSLVIAPTDVTDFHHHFWYKKGCLGQNEIHYSINNPSGFMNIRNLSTGNLSQRWYSSQDYTQPINDSMVNLPSGTYIIEFTYSGYISTAATVNSSLNHLPLTCQVIRDTIVIEGYQTPAITTSNSILCHNNIYIELIPDSSKGVPPYQYEIIAGPQLFPVQNSNIFLVNTPGIYTARIYDVCGNASTASITADTLTFPPIGAIQSTCNSIQLYYGSSTYYSYSWTGPNNQIYTGDTLHINPITATDTGIYHITRVVDINGCKDTLHTSYHLGFPILYEHAVSVCPGGSVTVGMHTYNVSGSYSDTLTSINGCDSIAVLNLTVLPHKRDSLIQNICTGQSFAFGTHTYNQAGIYSDTLSTVTCDSISVLLLTIMPLKKDSLVRNICIGQNFIVGSHTYNQTGIYTDTLSTATCDSIVVLNLTVAPLKKDSLVRNICMGQNFIVGSHTYNQTGIYSDTLSTATCDSIVVLNLTVAPLKKDSLVRNICIGQNFIVGSHTYNQTGIYSDTLSTATCDSIVILNLTVAALKKDSLVRNICIGQSFIVGSHTYNQSGIYSDTLSTLTCDSVVVLNLTVAALKKDSLVKNICIGQSFIVGSHTYNQTGIYSDTLSTATCDSIVILNLTVNPNPAVHITATPQVVDPGGTVQLNTTAGAGTYLWSSVASLNNHAIPDPVAGVSVSSWIYLQVTRDPGNCRTRDSVFIVVRIADTTLPCGGHSSIYVPNAFTPNGDSRNEVFRIIASNVTLYDFAIYNRWGELVFRTKDISQAWDGKYKGMVLSGNYVYIISYSRCSLSRRETMKGNITLIR